MKFIKICPVCGKHNEPSAMVCVESLTDICMVAVTREEQEPPKTSKQPILELLSPDNQSLIIEDGITIGREGYGNELFKDHLTISRRHAKFQYFSDDNAWKICDDGSKNGTYLNGERLSQNSWTELKEGVVISLSNRYKLKTTFRND